MNGRAERFRIGRSDALLCLAIAALFLVRLDYGELFNPDEARHAEIAREMLESGNYLTPRLHGEPYYDKPALFHWTLAASFAANGKTAASARLPSALGALWTLAVSFWWIRRAYSTAAARFAVIGLATSPFFLGIGRFAILDPWFVAALTTAFAWLGVWLLDARSGRVRGPWSLAPFYAAVGIAFLLKGPVAVVLAAIVAAGGVAAVDSWRNLAALRPIRGFCITAAVALPWYVAAWCANPAYIETFLWTHNVARYLGTGAIGHQHSFFYYLAALPIALLPWTPFVGVAICRHFAPTTPTSRADRFNLVWICAVLVVFLPAHTRLITYLLPAWPAFAALTADYAVERTDEIVAAPNCERIYALAWTFIPATAGLATVALSSTRYGRGLDFVAALPAFALAAYGLHARAKLTRRDDLRLLAAGTVACAVLAYGPVIERVFDWKGVHGAADLIRDEVAPATRVYSYDYPPHALAFYLERPVTRTKDAEIITRAVEGTAPVVVVAHVDRLDRLGYEPLPPGVKVIWSNESGRILLANTAAWPSRAAVGREKKMAEKGGSRTLRRPLKPTSRF